MYMRGMLNSLSIMMIPLMAIGTGCKQVQGLSGNGNKGGSQLSAASACSGSYKNVIDPKAVKIDVASDEERRNLSAALSQSITAIPEVIQSLYMYYGGKIEVTSKFDKACASTSQSRGNNSGDACWVASTEVNGAILYLRNSAGSIGRGTVRGMAQILVGYLSRITDGKNGSVVIDDSKSAKLDEQIKKLAEAFEKDLGRIKPNHTKEEAVDIFVDAFDAYYCSTTTRSVFSSTASKYRETYTAFRPLINELDSLNKKEKLETAYESNKSLALCGFMDMMFGGIWNSGGYGYYQGGPAPYGYGYGGGYGDPYGNGGYGYGYGGGGVPYGAGSYGYGYGGGGAPYGGAGTYGYNYGSPYAAGGGYGSYSGGYGDPYGNGAYGYGTYGNPGYVSAGGAAGGYGYAGVNPNGAGASWGQYSAGVGPNGTYATNGGYGPYYLIGNVSAVTNTAGQNTNISGSVYNTYGWLY
ncbi:MAG: hypothetical protein HQK54_14765 [Oligoflexales bacterium]|nr:hypothetical protein [Oligoflexales bacterium]